MSQRAYDALVIKFAKMMSSKCPEEKSVCTALQEICDWMSFDGGMVYEIDQQAVFRAKERYLKVTTRICESFELSQIGEELQQELIASTITCIDTTGAVTQDAIFFLHVFDASLLAAVTLIGNDAKIAGFIVFFKHGHAKSIDSDAKSQLSILMHMLKCYIYIRIYQSKYLFAEASLRNILDNTGIDIYVVDYYTYEVLYVNRTMAAPYGGISHFMGRKCWQVLYSGQSGPCPFCPQQKLIDENGNPTKVYSWDYQRPFDGAWFRVFSAAFNWIDGRLTHLVSSADITENKRNQALIEYMANYDALTGLPNRRRLVSECERRIDRAYPGERGYLLFFDIDGFKAINDTLGHDAGDDFLVQLGAFFSTLPLINDSVYRNGGDEFVAILNGDSPESGSLTDEDIKKLVHHIHERFMHPWVLKNGSVFCNTSVGVACYPDDGTTAEVLLNRADQAMYYVKKNGGGKLSFCRELPGASRL